MKNKKNSSINNQIDYTKYKTTIAAINKYWKKLKTQSNEN